MLIQCRCTNNQGEHKEKEINAVSDCGRMPLLMLPDEIINLIIYFYIPQADHGRGYGYCSIRPRLKSVFRGLINLSSTCYDLRRILGKHVFLFTSLVRRSELDSIMAYPRRMDGWSNFLEYRHLFISMAKAHYGPFHRGTDAGKRNYIASFVTRLEIPNVSLTNGDLHLFPELTHLSVLAEPMGSCTEIKLPQTMALTSLSLNIETLVASQELTRIASGCSRLDLLCDFNFCDPGTCFPYLQQQFINNSFREVDLFFSDSQALRYTSVVEFLGFIFASRVERLSLRLYKKTSGRTGPQFRQQIDSPIVSGLKLVEIISLSPYIKSLTMDLEMISRLDFETGTPIQQRVFKADFDDVCFTLVDYSLSVPKLLFRPREAVANIIQALHASSIVFAYGEVIDQAQLHALSVIRDLVLYLGLTSQRNSSYLGINMVFLEKAWSTSDDSMVRRYYELVIDASKEKLSQNSQDAESKILGVCLTDLPSLTSARYRQREAFYVGHDCGHDGNWPMVEWTLNHGKDAFWSVETSLRDLEHYSARERVLLSLWT